MELTRRCKDYWGFRPDSEPFGKTLDSSDGLFLWPEFEEVIERVVTAITKREYLAVVGAACSAKSTAWNEASRRLMAEDIHSHIATPRGIDPARFRDLTIYHAVKEAIEPPDGSRERMHRRYTEDRALQCRRLLERTNEAGHPVVLAVNDAHLCKPDFLLQTKRMWDDLYGFDRLLAIVLIGQPGLLRSIAGIREINERTEVVRLPGLVSWTQGGKKIAENHIEPYLHHELARCGAEEFPFAEDAIERLTRLARPNWIETQDHPLVVNNVVSRALYRAFRIKADLVDGELINQAIQEQDVI